MTVSRLKIGSVAVVPGCCIVGALLFVSLNSRPVQRAPYVQSVENTVSTSRYHGLVSGELWICFEMSLLRELVNSFVDEGKLFLVHIRPQFLQSCFLRLIGLRILWIA